MRTTISILILFFTSNLCFSQTKKDLSFEKRLLWAIEGGYTSSEFPDSRGLQSIDLGIAAEFKLSDSYAIKTSLSYIYAKRDYSFFGNFPVFNSNHLQVSATPKLYFSKSKKWYAQTGFLLRYYMSNNLSPAQEYYQSRQPGDLDFGFQIGLGKDIPLGDKNLIFLETNIIHIEGMLNANFKAGIKF